MEDISKINNKLDELISKYDNNATQSNPSNPSNQSNKSNLSIDQMISLLGSIETKYKFNSAPVTSLAPKTKYSILQDLVTKLEYELCVKESKNVDSVLNEIIGCLRSETPEIRSICSAQIKKMLETNYFNSNIKNKLNALIGLMG